MVFKLFHVEQFGGLVLLIVVVKGVMGGGLAGWRFEWIGLCAEWRCFAMVILWIGVVFCVDMLRFCTCWRLVCGRGGKVRVQAKFRVSRQFRNER